MIWSVSIGGSLVIGIINLLVIILILYSRSQSYNSKFKVNHNRQKYYNQSKYSKNYEYDEDKKEYQNNYNKNNYQYTDNIIKEALSFFGLNTESTLDDIKNRRLFMLKAYHPDRFENDKNSIEQAEQQTKRLNYYFNILTNYYKYKQ